MTSTLTRPAAPVVRRDDRRLHLPKRGRRALLVAHVLSSVVWFGIAVFVLFLLVVARSTGDAEYARALYRTVETSIWLSVPMAAVSAVTGLVPRPRHALGRRHPLVGRAQGDRVRPARRDRPPR